MKVIRTSQDILLVQRKYFHAVQNLHMEVIVATKAKISTEFQNVLDISMDIE